jgi:hypothetical protein
MKKITLFLIFCCTFLFSQAQLEDTWLRQRVGANWDLHKKWSVYGFYRMDLEDNLQSFRRSNIQLGANWQALKWLELGVDYRFVTSYNKDFHRYRIRMNLGKKLNNRWSLSLRNMIQHDILFLNKEYLQSYSPEWMLRNRLNAKYRYNTKWSANAYAELFSKLEHGKNDIERMRLGVGINYLYKRRHGFELGYFIQPYLDGSVKKTTQVFGIDYTFEIVKKKKKKKKKKSTQSS